MNFRLRSRHEVLFVAKGMLLAIAFAFLVLVGFVGTDGEWSSYDYRLLDYYYRQAVSRGYGVQPSFQPRIIYLAITDSSYNSFQKNILDRKDLARVNDALGRLGPEAVAYDIIFARPSNPDSDQQFSSSLAQLGKVYLPYACAVSEIPKPFKWETGVAAERLRADFSGAPREKGVAQPVHAVRALMQSDDFARQAWGAGDISAVADLDGVYRHMMMVLKVDERFVPTLSLSMFLDFIGTRFDEVEIEWGRWILIPNHGDGHGEAAPIRIPIDTHGRTFIPFAASMGKDFPVMAAHTLLENFVQEDMRGNLVDFFEGAFVFIADMAVGAADLGDIPLGQGVPLVALHAAMLNGMLTGTFYSKWTVWQLFGLQTCVCLFLGCATMQRSLVVFYGCGAAILAGLLGFAWIEFVHFRLFPVATICALTLGFFAGGGAVLQLFTLQERSFIHDTFSRYVPKKVVYELLQNPEAVKLGGEEKEATVLFSDIVNFTTLSESMSPSELVHLLNEYLTAMTDIILDAGGIIDKYEGDAIMAEFGIPLAQPRHADHAVQSALAMQRRLVELRREWLEKGQPPLSCRVGINSGKMLVGNMGSQSVMDYTVIGDAVNLASRLEGANKLYGTLILISQSTFEQLSPGIFRTRPLDVLKVKGKSVYVKVYEVYGQAGEEFSLQEEAYYFAYQQAFDAYLQRNFMAAQAGFRQALECRADDLAAVRMLKRIAMIDPGSLPEDWSGGMEG